MIDEIRDFSTITAVAENPIQFANQEPIGFPSRIAAVLRGSHAKAETEQGSATHRTTADS